MNEESVIIKQAEFQAAWHVPSRPYAPSQVAIDYRAKYGGGTLLLAAKSIGSAYFEVLQHGDFYHIIWPVDIGLVSFDSNEINGINYNITKLERSNVDPDFVKDWIKTHGSTRLNYIYSCAPEYDWHFVYDREFIGQIYQRYDFYLKQDVNKYTQAYSVAFKLNNVYNALVGTPKTLIDFFVDKLAEKLRFDLINKMFAKRVYDNDIYDSAAAIGLEFLAPYDFEIFAKSLYLTKRDCDLLTEYTAGAFHHYYGDERTR